VLQLKNFVLVRVKISKEIKFTPGIVVDIIIYRKIYFDAFMKIFYIIFKKNNKLFTYIYRFI